MRDSEIVASIVAGDPDGLAAAYDRYADALFRYCCSLLREPADAADAVQDTFVIAASRLAGLRYPDRLRSWLYAVARNECLRRLRSPEDASAFDDEPADDSADVGARAERHETRALLLAAADGLGPAERDVITHLWHGLEVAEIALVLDVSRNHAHALASRARRQLAASIDVLLLARSGRGGCAELDALLAGWDGQLTAALRRQLGRHIDKCAACSGWRRRAPSSALLLTLSPFEVLGALASGAATAVPRDRVLNTATGKDLHAEAYRGALWRSTGPFGDNGFPKPLQTSRPRVRAKHVYLAQAAAAIAAVAVTAVVLQTSGGTHHPFFAAIVPSAGRAGGLPGASAAPSAGGSSGRPGAVPVPPGGSASGPASAGTPSPGVSGTAPVHGSGPASPTRPATSGSPSPTPTAGGQPAPSGQPAPTGQPTASGQPAPTGQPASGVLTVAPLTVVLTRLVGGSITLTAENGPVTWSISEPASLLGALTVAPSSGTLAAGQSVQVTISETGLVSLDTQLTVSPGGQQVTVLLGLG